MKETAIKRSWRRTQRLGSRSLSRNRRRWKRTWRILRNQRKRRRWLRKRSWRQGGRRLIRSRSWNWSQRKSGWRRLRSRKRRRHGDIEDKAVSSSLPPPPDPLSNHEILWPRFVPSQSPGQWRAQNGDTMRVWKTLSGGIGSGGGDGKRAPLLLLCLLSLFHLLLFLWLSVFFIDF